MSEEILSRVLNFLLKFYVQTLVPKILYWTIAVHSLQNNGLTFEIFKSSLHAPIKSINIPPEFSLNFIGIDITFTKLL